MRACPRHQAIGLQECQHVKEMRDMVHRHLGEWGLEGSKLASQAASQPAS